MKKKRHAPLRDLVRRYIREISVAMVLKIQSDQGRGGAKFRIHMRSHPVAELDSRSMLFGFFVILTHRLTELCVFNAENIEKVYPAFQANVMTRQRRFSIILTINIMQLRGMSWRALRFFKTSVVNVLRLLRPLILRSHQSKYNFLSGKEWKKRR